jgi:hypothetical protein
MRLQGESDNEITSKERLTMRLLGECDNEKKTMRE